MEELVACICRELHYYNVIEFHICMNCSKIPFAHQFSSFRSKDTRKRKYGERTSSHKWCDIFHSDSSSNRIFTINHSKSLMLWRPCLCRYRKGRQCGQFIQWENHKQIRQTWMSNWTNSNSIFSHWNVQVNSLRTMQWTKIEMIVRLGQAIWNQWLTLQ